jgi:hypothetical protein
MKMRTEFFTCEISDVLASLVDEASEPQAVVDALCDGELLGRLGLEQAEVESFHADFVLAWDTIAPWAARVRAVEGGLEFFESVADFALAMGQE